MFHQLSSNSLKKDLSNFSKLKENVFFNIDIFNLIIINLYIFDIISSLLLINNTIFNFLFNNTKSINTISDIISYDYGNIKNDKYFSKYLKTKKFKSSYKMIHFYYKNIIKKHFRNKSLIFFFFFNSFQVFI